MPKAKAKGAYTKADMKVVSDNPEWTEKELAKAKPFANVFPDLAKIIGRRGFSGLLTMQNDVDGLLPRRGTAPALTHRTLLTKKPAASPRAFLSSCRKNSGIRSSHGSRRAQGRAPHHEARS
ncbi:hypothetical protein [Tardiphaga sp. 768_D3_N2_1]|uniref:hypothetical protein n=1 Tax=Tardiphaga sp. 768_D3_N2_1 TaxID=3240783 RepID=UPI003F895489